MTDGTTRNPADPTRPDLGGPLPVDKLEHLLALAETQRRLPFLPAVSFYSVPGSTDIAVLLGEEPLGVLTRAQYDDLRARLAPTTPRPPVTP
jgi:hypothetical protein